MNDIGQFRMAISFPGQIVKILERGDRWQDIERDVKLSREPTKPPVSLS